MALLGHLTAEIRAADGDLRRLITAAAPAMPQRLAVNLEVTGQLLTTVGDNPDRIRSEAAFAHLWGRADPGLQRQDSPPPA